MHVPDNEAVIADAQQFVQRELRGHEAEAPVFGRLRFQLPTQCLKLSQVLRAMESQKAALQVIAYALSQPTLEQVRSLRPQHYLDWCEEQWLRSCPYIQRMHQLSRVGKNDAQNVRCAEYFRHPSIIVAGPEADVMLFASACLFSCHLQSTMQIIRQKNTSVAQVCHMVRTCLLLDMVPQPQQAHKNHTAQASMMTG